MSSTLAVCDSISPVPTPSSAHRARPCSAQADIVTVRSGGAEDDGAAMSDVPEEAGS